MVDEGESAPDFTAPLANGDVEEFTLSERFGDAPLVLAFFPGAFTPACTAEMNEFQDELRAFDDAGATVYGISVDAPFSLNEFREQEDLEFGLVSDSNKEIIEAYDVEMDFADMGYYGVAKRAVFVVDGDGEIAYEWVSDDPSTTPDVAEVREAAESIA